MIKQDVSTCERCQTSGKEILQEPLHPIKPECDPFHMISMDIKHIACSRGNHKYIIVGIDYFTKWVEAEAVVLANSIEVATILLEEIISRHGTPAIILTDNGSPFINDLIRAIRKQFGIKHHRSSPYHPQSNGLVERFNRTVAQGLRMLPSPEKMDWHLYLPAFLFSYRCIKQASTGHSPFRMLYGRYARTPFENYLDQNSTSFRYPDESFEEQVLDKFQLIITALRRVHLSASDAIRKAQVHQMKQAVRRLIATKDKPPFLIGDMVLLYRENIAQDLSAKLEDRFDGPYYVHMVYDNSTYILKTPNGTVLHRRVHGNKLKIYKQPRIFFNPLLFEKQDGSTFRAFDQPTPEPSGSIQFKHFRPKPEQDN
ncbi:Pol polyprotein [Choanephora cucurbitarum]|uniref:Pol polyprotein n=1 Tax=Choanephora cucurbitarum TaxID=101091 RepID=A0A1C7N1A4_9FUNG|nr:Pol polyprotein [Choanephora cucurbitarum]